MGSRVGLHPRIEIARHSSLANILLHFPKMVVSAAQIYLYKPDMKADWLTVVAQNTPTLQALIVALFNRQQSKLKIVSWYVVPECTNQGLGQRLLAALEEWCQKQGIQTMTFEMRNGNVSYAPVTHVLQKQGWSEPQPLVHRFKVAVKTLRDLHWERFQRKSTRMDTFPLKSLSNRQRTQLLETFRDDEQFPTELLPFHCEQDIDCAVSLGLSQGNEVVGWIVAHHFQRDLIEYSALYVKPTARSTGAAILLLGKSFLQLAETGAVNVLFQVKVDNHLMIRFTRRHFQPILAEATLFGWEKSLSIGHN